MPPIPRRPRASRCAWDASRSRDRDHHSSALQGNPRPASATTAPAARSAVLPTGHVCARPMAMPLTWRQPVATTNPMLYASPLCPAGRQLGAVRVAVEDREERDDRRGDRERRLRFAGNHQTKEQRRESNPDLNAGERDADETDESAHGHHHRERHRQQPDGGRAELRAPQADGDHREHVVEPGEGDRPAGPLPPAGAEAPSPQAHLAVAARAGGC